MSSYFNFKIVSCVTLYNLETIVFKLLTKQINKIKMSSYFNLKIIYNFMTYV